MFSAKFLAQFLIVNSLNKIIYPMKSKALLTIAITMSALTGFSQAREVETTIQKNKGYALRMEINEPSGKVEKALQTQLSQSGVKGTKSKGLYQYKNIKLSPSINDSLNVYTRVEPQGKEKSVVYFAAQRPSGEFITEESDPAIAKEVSKFLYDFVGTNNFNSIDYDIYIVTDSVKMDETNYAKYTDDRKKLEQQRDQISKQLDDMEKTYSQSKADADRRKQRLDDLNRMKDNNPVTKKDSKPVDTKQQQQ